MIMDLVTGILPQYGIVACNLELILRYGEQQVSGIEAVAEACEVLDCEAQTHEVKPTLALESKLAAALISQQLHECSLVRYVA